MYSRVFHGREQNPPLAVPRCSRHTSGMENLSTAEVGALIHARRLELRITERRLKAAAKIDTKTLKGMESGERWPQEETRMKVERELQWMPGSIQALREGRAATPLPHDGDVPETPPLQDVPDEDLMAEIWRRLEEARSGPGRRVDDEPEHPIPRAFFGRRTDPGESSGEDRRQQGSQ